MAKIKKGDLVEVISGATEARGGDRGKQGHVIEVLAETNRVLVEGVNYVTKHIRVGQSDRGAKTGGVETHEAPIHISNVAIVDPKSKKPTRVGYENKTVEKNGVKKKLIRSLSQMVDHRWKVVEIWTWSQAITKVAQQHQHWEAGHSDIENRMDRVPYGTPWAGHVRI